MEISVMSTDIKRSQIISPTPDIRRSQVMSPTSDIRRSQILSPPPDIRRSQMLGPPPPPVPPPNLPAPLTSMGNWSKSTSSFAPVRPTEASLQTQILKIRNRQSMPYGGRAPSSDNMRAMRRITIASVPEGNMEEVVPKSSVAMYTARPRRSSEVALSQNTPSSKMGASGIPDDLLKSLYNITSDLDKMESGSNV